MKKPKKSKADKPKWHRTETGIYKTWTTKDGRYATLTLDSAEPRIPTKPKRTRKRKTNLDDVPF